MSRFFEDAVPTPYTILGLRLRPLSLGHRILLRRVGSAFLTGGRATLEDLAASVWICSKTYQEAIDSFSDPNREKLMEEWQEALGPFEHQPKYALFSEYLHDHSRIPPHQYPDKNFGGVDAPEEQVVKVTLMMETTLTEKEILDRPWALCLWDFLTIKAIKGQIQLTSEEKKDAMEEARKAAEAIEKKMKEKQQWQTGRT